MDQQTGSAARRAPRFSLGMGLILVTLIVCGAALVFRGPLRARYWAEKLDRSHDPHERARFAAALASAGVDAAWGVERLLRSPSGESRQFAALLLQSHPSTWARDRLMTLLTDADDGVRELAALALAMRGDELMIPRLEELYASGDARSAAAACVALERLGTAAAIAALDRLSRRPAEVEARAALVDALDGIRQCACGPVLLKLLSDERAGDIPTRAERQAERLLLRAIISAPPPASAPPRTIATRAAAALERLTGIRQQGTDEASRDAAATAWRRWVESCGAPASAPAGP